MKKTDYPDQRDMTRAEIRAYYRKRDKIEREIAREELLYPSKVTFGIHAGRYVIQPTELTHMAFGFNS